MKSGLNPTPWILAYLRSLTNIPHAQEIAVRCEAEKVFREYAGEAREFTWLAFMVELRHKAVERILHELKPAHILELGSGFSPSGLLWSTNGIRTYLETDTHAVTTMKRKITSQIPHNPCKLPHTPLPLRGDDPYQFWNVGDFFPDNEPVTVVSKGLSPRLQLPELTMMINDIRTFLQRHGGVWITTDVNWRGRMRCLKGSVPSESKLQSVLHDGTCLYPTLHNAESFWKNHRFKITRIPQRNLVPENDMSCLQHISIPPALREAFELTSYVWMLKAS